MTWLMSFPILFLSFITISFCNVHLCSAYLKTTGKNAGDLWENFVFVFSRNDLRHYFTLDKAVKSNEAIGRFNFTKEEGLEPKEDLISISVETKDSIYYTKEIRYLFIDDNQLLAATSEYEERSIFRRTPVGSSCTPFTLSLYPGNEPLVTPSTRSPFSFYLRSRYPTEPTTEFNARAPGVFEVYATKEENIMSTLAMIHKSELGDKARAYTVLLNLMKAYRHLRGKNIFRVAQLIFEDLGFGSDVFHALPEPVQLLYSGAPLKLFNGYRIPMKYNWASDQYKNIKHYTFERSASGYWAITYADAHQFQRSKNQLVEFVNSTKMFQFSIGLGSDAQSLDFYYHDELHNREYAYRVTLEGQDFYFRTSGNTIADFFVEPYNKIKA